ncbi:MAG: rRNA pseudouridine synthase [Candidatus Omnitrophica bacterium]|nr:rRNA pseudouridine synthase [Candidatus Omnitrophota bacterium]
MASRRQAAVLIQEGKVTVDGKVVSSKGLRVDPDKHEISVGGKPVKTERKCYFLFNKPKGVISTSADTHGRLKITDYFEGHDERLFSIGRLDKDTTGLIILTNDGELAHRLSHPSFEVEKEYIAKIEGELTPIKIQQLEKGVDIGEFHTHPCSIKVTKQFKNGMELSIILHEGRKRQIRLMMKAMGCSVLELSRVKYAGLDIKELKIGGYRELTREEVDKLMSRRRSGVSAGNGQEKAC